MALCMAHHQRLGVNSSLAMLDGVMLREILEQSSSVKIAALSLSKHMQEEDYAGDDR